MTDHPNDDHTDDDAYQLERIADALEDLNTILTKHFQKPQQPRRIR